MGNCSREERKNTVTLRTKGDSGMGRVKLGWSLEGRNKKANMRGK